jgi:hypothetical protein
MNLVSEGTIATTARTEFNNCQSQSVVLNGDPYLVTHGELKYTSSSGGPANSGVVSMRTTGALRFLTDGREGRAQYNCTNNMTWQVGADGTPVSSISSSGTISFEYPAGTPVKTENCGPPTP